MVYERDPAVLGMLVAHAAATWAMTGLIWFVQVVHYPLLKHVGTENFHAYHGLHTARTSVLTGLVMAAEAAMALALVWMCRGTSTLPLALAGAGLIVVVWVSTFAVQIPLHARLRRAADERVLKALTASNWVRTAAWSARGVIAALLLLAWGIGAAGRPGAE
jgi:hypothetical protein